MKLEVPVIAPIPVGHHVTVFRLERANERLLGGTEWVEHEMMIVCDDDTRIVYTGRFVPAESLRYDAIRLDQTRCRIAANPVRGVVTACAVLTDHGDGVAMKTLFELELDSGTYR